MHLYMRSKIILWTLTYLNQDVDGDWSGLTLDIRAVSIHVQEDCDVESDLLKPRCRWRLVRTDVRHTCGKYTCFRRTVMWTLTYLDYDDRQRRLVLRELELDLQLAGRLDGRGEPGLHLVQVQVVEGDGRVRKTHRRALESQVNSV